MIKILKYIKKVIARLFSMALMILLTPFLLIVILAGGISFIFRGDEAMVKTIDIGFKFVGSPVDWFCEKYC